MVCTILLFLEMDFFFFDDAFLFLMDFLDFDRREYFDPLLLPLRCFPVKVLGWKDGLCYFSFFFYKNNAKGND